MLPFRFMLSLAYRKVFPTSKFQTSLKGKVADRKAGHITYRRQLQRTAGKRKIQNSQVLATLRETKWKGCEGKEGQEESIGQKKVPVISSAPERSLSSASVSDLFSSALPQLCKAAGQTCLLLAFSSLYCKLVQEVE